MTYLLPQTELRQSILMAAPQNYVNLCIQFFKKKILIKIQSGIQIFFVFSFHLEI